METGQVQVHVDIVVVGGGDGGVGAVYGLAAFVHAGLYLHLGVNAAGVNDVVVKAAVGLGRIFVQAASRWSRTGWCG